jgi:hypothetical protein
MADEPLDAAPREIPTREQLSKLRKDAADQLAFGVRLTIAGQTEQAELAFIYAATSQAAYTLAVNRADLANRVQ